MKTILMGLGATLLLASAVSFADFNTDAKDGSVTCKDKKGRVEVTINAERKEFTVTPLLHGGAPSSFDVIGRDSDGDTEVTYTGNLHFFHGKDEATLSFDDQGDSLEYNGTTYSLRCPQ